MTQSNDGAGRYTVEDDVDGEYSNLVIQDANSKYPVPLSRACDALNSADALRAELAQVKAERDELATWIIDPSSSLVHNPPALAWQVLKCDHGLPLEAECPQCAAATQEAQDAR